MHTVTTTIVTSATGEITGYGFCVQAEHNGEPAEISACITESLAMLRTNLDVAFTKTVSIQASDDERPAEPGPVRDDQILDDSIPPNPAPAPPAQPAPTSGAPATAQEAEQRFYNRYGVTIGEETWAGVRRYLRQPKRPEPATVEQWMATAKAVLIIMQAEEARDKQAAKNGRKPAARA